MEKSEIKLTPEQAAAVCNRGGDLLVAAAAGSGKTRVLVERVLSYVTDPDAPYGIDEFLIITYTNAAAAELRGRILDALSERLAADPYNMALRRQTRLCYKAQIGTIHSFCSGLLRENAFRLNISPDFRVLDDGESKLLKASVLDALLEEQYEAISLDSPFAELVDAMSAGRDDAKLAAVLLDAYEKLQSQPDPEAWVASLLLQLEIPEGTDAGETIWGGVLLNRVADVAAFWSERMEKLLREADDVFYAGYGPSLEQTLDGLRTLHSAAQSGRWDDALRAVDVPFPSGMVRGNNYEQEKAIRQKCKDEVKRLKKLLEADSAVLLEDMRQAAPMIRELYRLVLELERRYAAEKRRRGAVDFSDQEHMALKLLYDPAAQAPTPLAANVAARYREILVDEYQDVNPVQERIFSALSEGRGNLFMVGDVKQSIYRFRLADPTIFLHKYNTFADADSAADGAPRRILLTRNFRSRAGVLDAVNFVFSNVMSVPFGEMEYTEREYLYAGAPQPPTQEPAVELDVLSMCGETDEAWEESPKRGECEAAFVAERIGELIKSFRVPEGDGDRPLRYGDIAILLRSANKKSERYAEALRSAGIPVASPGGVGFFQTLEVSVVLSLLSVIDNPRQDIPLISVLCSPIFGFTADDLAEIRTADRLADFFDALCANAARSEKCRQFLKLLEDFRSVAADLSVSALLWQIYSVTGVTAVMGAMYGGEARKQNLMLLLEYAVTFEKNGYKGLYSFISYLRELQARNSEPKLQAASAEDAVQIMTIHKSKGLEFPVVIAAGLSDSINTTNLHNDLLVHTRLGVGPRLRIKSQHLEYNTLARLAISEASRTELLAEELRVLYVAMTRAREKLILVASYQNAQNKLGKLQMLAELPVAPEALLRTNSVADWLLLPLLCRPEGDVLRGERQYDAASDAWCVRLKDVGAAPSVASEENAEAERGGEASETLTAAIRNRLDFRYPYAEAVNIPSKLTATQAKGKTEASDPESGQLPGFAEEKPLRRPDFGKKEKRLSGAEMGTALHTVMQRIDYAAGKSPDGVQAEIRRLAASDVLTEEEAQSVPAEKIERFFASRIGQIILRADRVYREFPFSILLPAESFYPGGGTDEILVQGVVDCCAETDGELVILDFKTDRVSGAAIQSRAEHYRPQIEIYAQAMSRILDKPVRERCLYFFTPETEISC